jgi:kinesin family protein 18/19
VIPTVRVFDEHAIIFDRREQNIKTNRRPRNAHFEFDRVFDQQTTSSEVFHYSTQPLIDDVLKGYNCTCFAYGATGAGKTYTMIGTKNNPGVIGLTMNELFQQIEMDVTKQYQVKISYLEIYNETIRDLLVECPKNLVLRSNDSETTVIGLSYHFPKNSEEVLSLLEQGNIRRSQSPTDANSESSRSHAVFQVYVQHTIIVDLISLLELESYL